MGKRADRKLSYQAFLVILKKNKGIISYNSKE